MQRLPICSDIVCYNSIIIIVNNATMLEFLCARFIGSATLLPLKHKNNKS